MIRLALVLVAAAALSGCAVRSAVSGDHLARLLVEDVHRADARADSLQVQAQQISQAGFQASLQLRAAQQRIAALEAELEALRTAPDSTGGGHSHD